eukprot:TRINITY_DN55363_c0_g1_i1.p1 TRINITY_DN55363_c0_g1~~TRINITY_DN55363_c0_g1_i1.p1  ORF type:complete len:304 (+),score=52.53 TRINITY_DN55363_c0_g1_i1:48-914(+)
MVLPCSRIFILGAVSRLIVFDSLPSQAAPAKETPPRTELSNPCSRVTSRHVRKQLEKEVLRPSIRDGTTSWPKGCPWDVAVDMYANHEKQKTRKRPSGSSSTWQCGICGKTFKTEHYLDLHLERQHMNYTPKNPVCLADYCEVFEVCQGDSKFRRRDKDPPCKNETMMRARRRCEDAIFRCFPLDQEVSRRLHAKYSKQFCRVLDCRIRDERRKETDTALMPVIVILILVVLLGFIVFSIVVCCVDYSDDILQFLLDSRIASTGFVKRTLKARDQTRQVVGLDRTKTI